MIKKIGTVYFLLVGILSLSCKSKKKPGFYDIVTSYVKDSNKGSINQSQAVSASIFTKYFIESYRATCDEFKSNPDIYNELSLVKDEFVSTDFYFSNSRECFIYIYKSNPSHFLIKETDLPLQFFITNNQHINFDQIWKGRRKISVDEIVRTYDSTKTAFGIFETEQLYIHDMSIEFYLKFFTISKESIVYLNNLRIHGITPFGRNLDTTLFTGKGMAVFFGNNKIDNEEKTGKDAGLFYANLELQNKFINSEYFKEVKANKLITPLAEQILIKQARALQDANYKYSLIEFRHDQEMIRKKIEEYDIQISAEDLFSDVEAKLRTGTLIWFYDSYAGFSLQWALINFVWLLFVVLLLRFHDFKTIYGPWDDRKTLFAFLITLNTWIYYKIPKGMSIQYWYPAISILLTYYLFFIKTWKIRKK